MRNLRYLLLVSHLSLVALMAVVMAGAVINFLGLGRSIDRIFKDNYKSVIAAQQMKEALEREDSAALFYLSGHVDKAKQQFDEFRKLFQAAYQIEANNITEAGEQEIADELGVEYRAYEGSVQKLLSGHQGVDPEASRKAYFNTLEPMFRNLKARAQQVLDLNQQAILRADRHAKDDARRASIAAVAVTIIAFVLALFFSIRMVRASLAPVRSLARQAEEIGAGHLNQSIDLQRSDEIGALAQAFNSMSEKLREARKQADQKLHRAERMSDAALESLYDPVLVTDAEGRVAHLNRAAEGLFGRESWAAGLSVREVTNEDRIADAVDKAIHQEHVSAPEGEEGHVSIASGDAQRTYRLRATPMTDTDGVLLGAAAVLEDITHLRELDRLKTEFIGVASHELRTPVTSLLLSVKLLEEGAAGPLTPQQLELVAAQKEDLTRLERMMQELLDVTRLESGVTPPRFEICSLGDVVQRAVNALAALAGAKGVKLVNSATSPLPVVRIDPALIHRGLVNLLDNAIRHTPDGGQVSVEVGHEASDVFIAIRDTGSGIPAEYLPRVFERFMQVPGATRGGSGLGLSIARTIAKAHGGDITVESASGKGSCFRLLLPNSIVIEEARDGTDTAD